MRSSTSSPTSARSSDGSTASSARSMPWDSSPVRGSRGCVSCSGWCASIVDCGSPRIRTPYRPETPGLRVSNWPPVQPPSATSGSLRNRTSGTSALNVERSSDRSPRGWQIRLAALAGEELLVTEEIGGRMIRGVPAGNPGQLFTAERFEPSHKCLSARQCPDLRPRVGDVLADLHEMRRFRRVHAAANPHPCRRDLEIEPGALMPVQSSPRKARRDVRLERRLVGAEARVAVDSIEGGLRRGDELRRELT